MDSIAFAVLAFLPLGLASLSRRSNGTYAGFGFLAALAPMLASGVSSLIGHKQKKSAEKKQAEYERQMAAQQEAQRKTEYEAKQDSPAAQLERMSWNMRLGKLLGKAGGREKLPPSMLKAYDSARTAPQYTAQPMPIERPRSGAGVWDFAGGLANALSYLDTSKRGQQKQPAPNIVPTQPNPQAWDPRPKQQPELLDIPIARSAMTRL